MQGRARSYHDATKQTWRGVRASTHTLDWDRQPVPFKLYPDLPPITLPLDLPESDWPALDALSGIRPPNRPRPWELWLPWLLFYAAGVTRRLARPGGTVGFRAASSAGALYPIEVYVVCQQLGDELPAGLYHFEPYEFALRRLREGDHRAPLAAAAVDDAVASAPVSLVLTGVPYRSTWKYGARGYRHVLWDCGTVVANLLALAEARDLPARVVLGFADRLVARLLGTDPAEEVPLAVVPVGDQASDPADHSTDLPPITAHPSPLVPEGAPEPGWANVHRAGDLDNAASTQVWRERIRGLHLGQATQGFAPPLLPLFDTIEEVILRRGAARRFASEPLDTVGLTWPLAVASRPLVSDALDDGATLVGHLFTAFGVAGVPPGAYRWTVDGPELLRPGAFRGESATMCLEQDLGGEGAYTVFHSVHLDRLLEAAGDRGYRVAHVEAGVCSGRLQLAAHTLGVSATPLTFYDDDVSRFFSRASSPSALLDPSASSPSALLDASASSPAALLDHSEWSPALVTAVGSRAYAPRRGRRPSEDPPPPLER